MLHKIILGLISKKIAQGINIIILSLKNTLAQNPQGLHGSFLFYCIIITLIAYFKIHISSEIKQIV